MTGTGSLVSRADRREEEERRKREREGERERERGEAKYLVCGLVPTHLGHEG